MLLNLGFVEGDDQQAVTLKRRGCQDLRHELAHELAGANHAAGLTVDTATAVGTIVSVVAEVGS